MQPMQCADNQFDFPSLNFQWSNQLHQTENNQYFTEHRTKIQFLSFGIRLNIFEHTIILTVFFNNSHQRIIILTKILNFYLHTSKPIGFFTLQCFSLQQLQKKKPQNCKMNSSHKKQLFVIQEDVLTPRNKKLRPARQSEPNLFVQDVHFQSLKLKEENQIKLPKPARQPRMSQAPSQSLLAEHFYSPKHQHQYPRPVFLSPTNTKQPKIMTKTSSNTFFIAEPQLIKLMPKNTHSSVNLKMKKNPIEAHKQTLNKIEQMLLNHGVNLTNHTDKKNTEIQHKKTLKSPRFSQHLNQQNQLLFQHQIKQKRSYGNEKKKNDQKANQQIQLKQTVSTHSSYKSNRKLKLSQFQVGKQIGKGKFGTVKIARHKKTGMIFCLKIVKKSLIKKQQITQQFIKQIKIQSFLNQPNIIKLYAVFDDSENVYLLLQLCCQGNLYQFMQKKGKIDENQTRIILKSVCQAISSLHQQRIMHRDLKPENIVLFYGMAKICDFGWSTQIKDSMRQTFCGTPLYVSPELLSGSCYDQKVDLWAIGILGYEMMSGRIPFEIKSEKDLTKIINSKIVFPKSMSPQAVSFLQNLLERDPEKRKSIRQLLMHPFLQKQK